MKYIFAPILLCVVFAAASQSAIGTWKTIDDETGREKSVVEIFEKDGKVYGKIIQLFRLPDEDPDPICDECDDDDPRYNQKVLGMEIIKDMVLDKDDNEYVDGTILDPANGNVYDCKMWVEDGELQVRGYIAFLFRTQTWLPYK
ncbi:MAG: DUF2147 domain-containing protein [Cyclobacteriaceae bacterium]